VPKPDPEGVDPATSRAPLSDFRVIELSTWIGGAYCTKLLADGGAEVIKVESPTGDPLRRWSASGAPIAPDADGALFNFLAASKQSVVVDLESSEHRDDLTALMVSADAVVWSAGSPLADHPDWSPKAIRRRHPDLIVTTISPFGLEGPWSAKAATEFTLQAWSGAMIGLARGNPERAPVYVGGQIGEWLSGVFAAVGTLAARRTGSRTGELVDVSMLETLAMCLTYYPVTFHDQLGRPMRKRRYVPTPGVGAARDGLVGLGCGTGQQWLDFCVMVGHDEWMEDQSFFLNRATLEPTINAWIAERTGEEVLELASAFRIPNAPIANGGIVTSIDHYVRRQTFAPNPRDGAANPRPPYRMGSTRLRAPTDAPFLGAQAIGAVAQRHSERSTPTQSSTTSAFKGLRVLDMTAYWAGPLTGHMMALMGAEVIHLESAKRPDGVRMVGGVSQKEDQYWERGPIFSALNTNKKSLTIDFSTPQGLTLLRRFIATCDVVIENYTPRVLDQLGLTFASLQTEHPDLIMVRMPGFGLDGPWREQAAFAFVIEDAAGLTSLTGHPDLLPIEPYCVGDSNAGLHALFGLLLAIEHRESTGQGGLVEVAMVDAALNVAAEQAIEYSAYGNVLERSGNRGPCAAPQNLYRVTGPDEYGRDDCWVAIAVATDEQWLALRHALGEPEWATDQALVTVEGRCRAHDQIDAHLEEWCAPQTGDEVVKRLWDVGVPTAKVMLPHRQPDLPQLESRQFFEELEHPVIGSSRYATLPMKFSGGPERVHQTAAPLLGQHNTELLGQLGLSEAEIDALEADGIIGSSLVQNN
jgi:crotonobetainyl-CoA:carnitine CoA-transferase CaiB-like acyl-CoA transferase